MSYRGKRALDLAVAVPLVVLTAPVQAATAVAVAVTLGRPVLFRQDRPGLHGELFTLHKFRTMRDPVPGQDLVADADRLTPFGRWLRSTSLDELPSLWHVLRGEMSLVGPRPLLPAYLDLYDAEQARRHDARPGLTGLAQVAGRNAVPWDERLALDVRYADTASLGLDLRILGRTLLLVLSRRGISGEGSPTMAPFTGGSTS